MLQRRRGLAKLLRIQLLHLHECLFQGLRIVFPSQTKVRKVMQKMPKRRFAIGCVFAGVEDVHVPEAVDVLLWRERHFGVLRVQDQIALVGDFHLVRVVGGPAVAVLLATGFELDRGEVECLNGSDGLVKRLAVVGYCHECSG